MNKNEIIEKYLNEEITTFLSKYEISEAAIEIVKEDIGKRIYSLLYHWNDFEFRNAFLSIGLEEATYYQPSKNLDLKSFVVVAIRNSQFENLVSTREAMASIGCDYNQRTKRLEQEVDRFTSKAISYFRRVDFGNISKEITLSKEEDYFGEIAATYPSAFLALSKISNTKQLEVHYEKVSIQKYEIPELQKNVSSNNIRGAVILSGLSELFDDRLILMLQQMKRDGYAYFDSFKMLTRNTEKLFKVLEFALTHNCVFLTSNFYISNTYISRRKTLLRPAHYDSDYYKNLKNVNGLLQEQKKLKQRHIQRSAV